MILSKKSIYLAIAAIVAAVCIMVSVGVFAIGPQRKAISAIDDIMQAKEAELFEKLAGDNSSDGDMFAESLSQACKDLSKYVIRLDLVSEFVVDINRLANKAGLQELNITNRMLGSYSAINECQHIREGRIQIKFESSFSEFAKFVNSLERYKPVIFIDTFKIRRSGSGDRGNDVDMVLTFFVSQNSLKDLLSVNRGSNNVSVPIGNEFASN